MADDSKIDKKIYQQYAALPMVVQDGELRVLLITSRQTRRWVIPKGWPEKDLNPSEVAAREAYEEAGLVGRIGAKSIGSYDYYKQLGEGRQKHCMVSVYPLSVQRELEDWPEKGQREKEWMTPAQAALKVNEAGLITLLLTLAGAHEDDDPFVLP